MYKRSLLAFRPKLLKPDVILPSVHDLTTNIIAEHGIRCLVFDVDDTLTYHRGTSIGESTLSHLQGLRDRTGVTICIASNSRRNLEQFGAQLEAKVIHSTLLRRKPRRVHFRRIVKETGFVAHEIAMVGDKLWTDVLGGNLAGMTTVWVLSRKDKFFHRD